ncbi:MAG: ribokinase [Pseudomonadota bacterium]
MTLFVVGNVTEDLIFSVPRLPGPGETLIADERHADLGGKGLNQALIAARAGCTVTLIAAVGEDAAGESAHRLAAEELPGTKLITVAGVPTDQSLITVAPDGENHIVSTAFAANALTPARIAPLLAAIGAGDACLVQGNLSADATQEALTAARTSGALTVANPSPIRWPWAPLWPLIDIAILNRIELQELSGEADVPAGARRLLSLGAASVLVTLGADGACFFDATNTLVQAAGQASVVDTAGAGDTFCAVFVAMTLDGAGAKDALRVAAELSALTVSRRGTLSAFPSRAEIARCRGPVSAL